MLPLTGVTVLAVEQYGAGPFGTQLLGDMGADVIKIENPEEGGELGRRVGPYFFGDKNSHFFQAFNRNKRSMTLNLKKAEGREIFHQLVARADAVLNNLRGDQPEKLGLTYSQLSAHNPRIVCAHLSAYGRTGPRKSWPGFDYLMQAEAGYLSVTGEPDGPPARMGLSIVDMMTGLMTVFGLASGVIGARASGKGMDVDVSLFDTALHNLSYLAVWYLNSGHLQGREERSGHPSLVPSQLFKTKDGWLFIMCNKENFWPVLAEKIGKPEWASDPRFATFKARLENRALVQACLDEVLSTRSTEAWLAVMQGAVPVAPVYDIRQALENPFVAASDRVGTFAGGAAGDAAFRMLAGPIRINGNGPPTVAGPGYGHDTVEMLRQLGCDDDRIDQLRRDGVI